jgi:hypothetical protein
MISRVATFSPEKNEIAFIIGSAVLLHRDLPLQASEKAVEAMIRVALIHTGVQQDFWVHKNRDSTWALAIGKEPKVWPEDEPVIIEKEHERSI